MIDDLVTGYRTIHALPLPLIPHPAINNVGARYYLIGAAILWDGYEILATFHNYYFKIQEKM